MKIFCEYCNSRIDTLKDDCCPKCGASYKENKEYLKYEEEQKQTIEQTKDTFKKVFTRNAVASKIITTIAVIIFIAVIAIMVISISKHDDIGIFSLTQKKVVANINEYAITKKYEFKVTGFDTKEDIFGKLTDDEEYVTFHFVVNNLTKNKIDKEDVNCLVDNIAQDNYYSSGYSTLPFDIGAELAVKGDATFAVPKDATKYSIKYGDFVTINVEK